MIVRRSGQATVEWLAVITATATLAVGAVSALRAGADGLDPVGPMLAALVEPAACIWRSVSPSSMQRGTSSRGSGARLGVATGSDAQAAPRSAHARNRAR